MKSWNKEPVWFGGLTEETRTKTRLYDMETSHIKNCVKAMKEARIAFSKFIAYLDFSTKLSFIKT